MNTEATALSRSFATLALLFDEDGFLVDPDQWTQELSSQLADASGLGELTPRQWATIAFIREKYLRVGALPPMRRVCKKLNMSKAEIKALFGGCRQLWRIAGLPNPGEEARTYMD